MRIPLLGATVAAALAVIAGATAIAYAAIPGADGVISSCYKQAGGDLRVVDGGQACKSQELSLTWSQVGEPGPAGPAGPQGEVGPAGPAGPPGDSASSGVFFKSAFNRQDIEDSGVTSIVQISDLPAGKYLLEARVTVAGQSAPDAFFFPHVTCELPGAGPFGTQADAGFTDRHEDQDRYIGNEQLEVTGALDHPGGDVALKCSSDQAENASAGPATLLATPVGSIN